MKENVLYVQNLEKAIQDKFGKEAVADPRADWTDEEEKEYLEQKMDRSIVKKITKKEKRDADGFLVSRKLLNSEETRTCPVCEKYSFEIKDNVYIKKFECCHNCFILHVEGREERWQEKKRKLIDEKC